MSVEVIEGIRAIVCWDFQATADRLFRAFTDPAEAARWMWGANAPNVEARWMFASAGATA